MAKWKLKWELDLPTRDSAYTPFLRRWTDERALELTELRQLYDEVRAAHLASPYSRPDARIEVGSRIYEEFAYLIPEHLLPAFSHTLDALLKFERTIFEMPEIRWDIVHLTLKEQVDLRRFLRSKQYFLAHHERVIDSLTEGLSRIFGGIADLLPQTAESSLFTVPLINTLPIPKLLMEKAYGTLCEERYGGVGLFTEAVDCLYRNLCKASGREPYKDEKKAWKNVSESNLPLQEAAEMYLAGSPFLPFFLAPVPLKLTYEDRFSHMHVVGGSGAGKTTLLQHLILTDLGADDPPALVVVDSQGDLINKLSRLLYFGEHHERFVYITPKDIQRPPALNVFDLNRARLDQYDETTKEQVTAGVIQTFDYLFSGLFGADLSAKQGVFFRFVARLMLALPQTMGRNATILDMMRLMADVGPYRAAIESLPPIPREFFERDFSSKTFTQTKEQIRYRLNAILENPTLARLFTSTETKVDLFTELNKGSVIFVDTAKDFLKGSSAHFGRIFISLVLQAVLERAAIPEHKRKPAFLIVDEAADYFDSNIDDLLTEARKYKLGCVFAHQFLDQATSSLRSSLAANTSIKMAAGVSVSDARAMAPDMRTTPDFILDQPRLHFACHIRNTTPNAVSVPVYPGMISDDDLLPEEGYAMLRELNSHRVSVPVRKEVAPPAPSTPDTDKDGTPSKKW